MKEKIFISISKKIRSIIFITLFSTIAVFIFISSLMNLLELNNSLAVIDNEIKKNLISKGRVLVTSNSIALRGMAEDNSFSAIKDLVIKTVQNDSEIIYGIFMDTDKQPWIYYNGTIIESDEFNDPISLWASKLVKTEFKEINKEDKMIFEFAAPVNSNNERLGTIRYGFSLESIKEKIAETKAFALKKSIISILLFVFFGFIIFILISIASTKRIKKIIIPLNELTKASETISNGNYSATLKIDSNDEIGVLAKTFNLMKDKIQVYTEDLHKKEEEYRILYETAVIGLFRTRISDGKLLKANKRALEMFGFSSLDKALNNDFKLSDYYPSEQRKEILEKLKQENELSNIITRFKFENGKKIIASVSIKKHEKENFLEGSILDITETISAEEQLKKKEQQLIQAQKMETIGNLAGGLAHDFNNVLGGIVGTLSIIQIRKKKNILTTEKLEDYLNDMNRSANRATNLVKQLLTLTRKQDLTLTSLDLNNTIKNVIKICKTTFDKSIIIKPLYSKTTSIIKADITQIEQVLLNLAINSSHAMTFMRKDGDKWGGELEIGLRSFFADKIFCEKFSDAKEIYYWELFVIDEGIGMNDSVKEKIFDPFYTTKEREKGSGLGLSMVYNIVKQHNGFINLYSEYGKGSKFSLYFPQLIDEEINEKEKQKGNIEFNYKGSVLIVDDEPIMRKVASEILSEMGFNIIIAEDGMEGLNTFIKNQEKLKLVILDLIMPKKSGDEVLIEIKKINKDIKVLLTSGFKRDERLKKISIYENVSFIEKPYSFEQLSNAVVDLLNKE